MDGVGDPSRQRVGGMKLTVDGWTRAGNPKLSEARIADPLAWLAKSTK